MPKKSAFRALRANGGKLGNRYRFSPLIDGADPHLLSCITFTRLTQ